MQGKNYPISSATSTFLQTFKTKATFFNQHPTRIAKKRNNLSENILKSKPVNFV